MFKPIQKEPELKLLSDNEIKKLKEKLSAEKEMDLRNLIIKDLKMEEMLPQYVNGVAIVIDGQGYHNMVLPVGMDKAKFKTFRKSPGGIFAKDSLRYSKKKEYGKYLLIEGNGERKLIRLIEDGELTVFKSLRLIHGMIKDRPFMLLKNLGDNEKITGTYEYINENSDHEEVEDEIIIETPNNGLEDDYETNTYSVSLFDD